MRSPGHFAIVLTCLLCVSPAWAQKQQREPLTSAQVEKIREAGIDPAERVKLYTTFLNEHVDSIKALTARARSSARVLRMDSELQDLTALMDELGSNLDQYAERKADLRKSLKPLAEATQNWLGALRAVPSEPGFELSRKEAIESGQDLAEQASRLLEEQTAYFKIHKDERGQDRAEPKQ
ncbi:MAG: hypothetical protein KGM96_05625 [Acidobacteriota bacterium]|nr:hypothetical protein [Acidobacteriota bacterium]